MKVVVRYQEPLNDHEACYVISFPETQGMLAIPVSCWPMVRSQIEKIEEEILRSRKTNGS